MSKGEHGPAFPYMAEMHHVPQDPQLLETNPPLVRADGYHDLTEQISTIIEGDVLKTPLKYWITLRHRRYRPDVGSDADLPGFDRNRRVGQQSSDRMGVGYYELRVLDRYRARGDTDLGDSVPVPAEVADLY
jgi:hypothetical protein